MSDNSIYVEKYKKTAKKLGIAISIFISVLGLAFIGVGIFLICYKQDVSLIIISVIMMVVGILDIILGIRFKFYTDRRLEKISDREAFERYIRIHGYDNKK